jgi:predicted amidohydrolase
MLVGPDGHVLAEAADGDAESAVATLERAHLETVRETNPSLANRRL